MAEVFVFGSNLQGIHGAGSAREALDNHGAARGQGVGRWGNSYAIPTKDTPYHTLSLGTIRAYVREFVAYATQHPEDTFRVVKVGCGLAGLFEEDIAPMFKGAPDNVILPDGWREMSR